MPANDLTDFEKTLMIHEGSRMFMYIDNVGYATIGVGRNIDSRCGKGLSHDEQVYLMRNDIEDARSKLSPYDWFQQLDSVRQEVLMEMIFNMGLGHFKSFVKFIQAIKNKDYNEAAIEMCNSAWAKQIGPLRLNDLLYRMQTGKYGAPA